ncbi:MAG: hypothetical protein AB7L71_02465 [Vicinamibacterales bacterium]
MADGKLPNTKLQMQPGEDVWAAMARELSANPESPVSLRIRSAMNQAMQPRHQAVEQLVAALEALEETDDAQNRAAADAAVQHWERECHTPMEPGVLEDLRREARERVAQRRRAPPPMQSILGELPPTTDVGYEHGLHLEGIAGTWHRLWAAMCLCYSFGHEPGSDSTVATVRTQFEEALGRAMTQQEFDALAVHAHGHYLREMKPNLKPGG